MRAPSNSDQVRRGGDQRERPPPSRRFVGHLAEGLRRPGRVYFSPGQIRATGTRRQLCREHRASGEKQRTPTTPGVDHPITDGHGGAPRVASPHVDKKVPGQIVGENRPEKRSVNQAAPEFLSDNRHLDARGAIGTQRSPARCLDLPVQPRNATFIVEILNRTGSKIVGQLCGGVA